MGVVLVEVSAVVAGVGLVVLGLWDAFLTILHPDRDGPASVALNRWTWRVTVATAERVPAAAPEILAFAGAWMIAATITLWMLLEVVGFALLAWPFLGTHFQVAHPPPITFFDAVYWSAVTFTTLGYGDIIPLTPLWKVVAIAEALAGFGLVGAAVTFLLSVFRGVEHRDQMALRIYSETRRTWDGRGFVLRLLEEEGPEGLVRHVEVWAEETRSLHESLYRFQPLAFYVRTRSEKHEPERMLEAVAEVALTARVLARSPRLHALRPAADEIDIAYTEFAMSAIRHHGTKRALRAFQKPEPTDQDRETVQRVKELLQREGHLDSAGLAAPEEEFAILALACRLRVFLAELDRITCLKRIRQTG